MSFRDVYTFYIEPDDPDEIEYSEAEIEAFRVEYEYQKKLDEAEKILGTADCVHLYAFPDENGKWHCVDCGTEV